MGGSSKTKETHDNTTNTNQTQTTTAPGTAWGQNILDQSSGLVGDVLGKTAFTGDRVAAPGQATQVAQWGTTPSTFIPQRTATDVPTTAGITNVDPHNQGAIDTALGVAQGNSAQVQPLVGQAFSDWGQILAGPNNSYVTNALDAARAQHDQAAAVQNNQLASLYGQSGAYGGSDMARGLAFATGQQQQAWDITSTQAELQNYQNWLNTLGGAGGAISSLNSASMQPQADIMSLTDATQANLQHAASVGDQNAQILLNNLNNAQRLNDANAVNAANEAIAQWQAQYQSQTASAAQTNANTAFGQQTQQASMDNAYLQWLAGQENTNNKVSNIGQLIQAGASVPGGTTTGSGTSHETGTSTTSQSTPLWQQLMGIGGAGLQAFAPGGMFSGSLKGLGGMFGAGAAATGAAATGGAAAAGSSFLPWLMALSDRRVKHRVLKLMQDARGINWYRFAYLWDKPGTEHVGVMSDEIPEQFVHRTADGFDMVDYGGLQAWGW